MLVILVKFDRKSYEDLELYRTCKIVQRQTVIVYFGT